MHLNLLSTQLVQELRGKRLSQQALSRRLGYGSNVLYLWERGRRFPVASAFLALAQVRRPGLRAALEDFVNVATRSKARLASRTSQIPVAPLLVQLAAGRGAAELAKLSGCDRNTIARWLRGASEPRLPELLRFVGVTTLRLVDFVALFADPARLEATRDVYENLRAQRDLAYTSPWSHAVLRALELDAYRTGQEGVSWLARRLGLSVHEVEATLRALEHAGQVHRDGGNYQPTQVLSIDTRTNFDHNLRLKDFWAGVARQRLSAHRKDRSSAFSYNLFAISDADLQRLRQLQAEYYERVRQFVASARGADRVVLLNLQLAVLDEI